MFLQTKKILKQHDAIKNCFPFGTLNINKQYPTPCHILSDDEDNLKLRHV